MEQDHAALGEVFRQLDLTLGEGDTVRSFELLDLAWARLAVHIRAEHLHLFPAVLNALAEEAGRDDPAKPSLREARACLERLREDHNFFMRELADAIKSLRELSHVALNDDDSTGQKGAVRRKAIEVAARLDEHNRLEELKVYRWPARLLGPEAQVRLVESLRGELENMPPRFDDPTVLRSSS
jgi:hypothetical protein